MPRSRLWPYRDDIAEALDAGTSMVALARTYGCGWTAMASFIDHYVPRHRDADRLDRSRSYHRVENLSAEQLAKKHARNHSFAGVVSRYRYVDRKALERLEQQAREVL